VGYAVAAVAFAWPLPLHFSSRLMGPPASDLGVYLWNLWVFGHEVRAGHYPLFTSSVFSLDPPIDLSLHNYTLLSDILALPLVPTVGVVATYNALCLGNLVAGAFAMFLLARHVTGRPCVSWLAGLLFGFSPTLAARATIHASLAAAAPLPLFALVLLRLDATRARRWAVAAGCTLAWAAVCDPYYAIYCVLIAAGYLVQKALTVRVAPWAWRWDVRGVRALDGFVLVCLVVSTLVCATGGGRLSLGPVTMRLQTLYTPVLLLTVAAVLRVAIGLRLKVSWKPVGEWFPLVRLAPLGGLVAGALLSPVLYLLGSRAVDGRFVAAPVYWRSSMPGADLAALIMPNPNHPWFNALWGGWLAARPNGYVENVVSITAAALIVVLAAVWLARFAIPAGWGLAALASAGLTLGPFIQVAGANTAIPTPWTLLRYLPPFSWARSPTRFGVVLMLVISVIFALALGALVQRFPRRRGWILAGGALLLVLELLPVQRPLFDARVPGIYDRIAADPRNIRVLELPFGVRDGLSSFGDFSPATLVHQTRHGKPLIGGYLSRVSARRIGMVTRRPVLAALMALSEGRPLSALERQRGLDYGPPFVRKARIGYVVVDRGRASRTLEDFAVRALDLQLVAEEGLRRLYRPRERPDRGVVVGLSAQARQP